VIELNEPQVWTMMGIFSATIFAMLGVVSSQFIQILRAEIGRIGVSIDGIDRRMDGIDKRLDGIDKRLDGIDRRMDGFDKRFDALDRDVHAIARRVFPES
jgi:hypothetical protein